jgi:hypothetical protein
MKEEVEVDGESRNKEKWWNCLIDFIHPRQTICISPFFQVTSSLKVWWNGSSTTLKTIVCAVFIPHFGI